MVESNAERLKFDGDVIMVFYKDNKFLLSHRSPSNPKLPNKVIFPSETSYPYETPHAALIRGAQEEMDIEHLVYKELPIGKMAHTLGGSQRQFKVFIVSDWDGEIKNTEPEKESFVWTERNKVMGSLTVVESQLIYLLVLADLRLLKASDFDEAPKIQKPELS